MRRIALVNQKGGVGKTTTAVNLSAAISRLDRRVLLIDLDPQSNATVSLGVPPDQQKNNTSYGLLNGAPFQPVELSPNFHLVPSNIELAGAEMELTSVIGREIVLRDALADVKGYDFMILDCSPSLGLLSVNALTTAKEVMVPLQCEFLALHGISLLMRTIDLVRKRLNTELSITGVIPCMYDVRKGLARDVVVEIEKHFGNKVFKSKIRSNVRLAEAPSHGKSIFDYAPDSYGAEDYLALAREIVGIEVIQREPLAAAAPIPLTTPAPELEISLPLPELVVAGALAGSDPFAPAAAPPHDPMPDPILGPTSTPGVLSPPELEAPACAPELLVEPAPAMPETPAPASAPIHDPMPDPILAPTGPGVLCPPALDCPASVPELLVEPAPAMPEPPAPASAPTYDPMPDPIVVLPFSEGVLCPPAIEDPLPLPELRGPEAPAAPETGTPPGTSDKLAPGCDPVGGTTVPEGVPLRPEPQPLEPPPVPEIVETPAPAPLPSPPSAQQVMPDIVSDGVVEFIELIPLDIEELPFVEPERTA